MNVELWPFEARFAETVASWVETDHDLLWLAPRTPPPLTALKVLDWGDESNTRYLLRAGEGNDLSGSKPCGYGEINRMTKDPNQLWLGHIVIERSHRGRGLGGRLVGLLLREAFEQHDGHTVSLVVFPRNEGAIRCYTREGFVREQDEYHHFRPGGPKHRMVRMDVTRERWTAKARSMPSSVSGGQG